MGDQREWFALTIRDTDESLADLLVAVLDDHALCAIGHLDPMPLPPGGVWDPSYPPPPDPPPGPLAWRAFFRTRVDRDRASAAIAERFPAVDLAAEEVGDGDWAARSQQQTRAVTAGEFTIAPPWDVPGLAVNLIIIEPSRGFGTGHHPSTRLCLRAMSAIDFHGRSVLDVGTGSGVLAMAAALAGAREVTAIDIDPDAIEAAQQSLALNHLPIPIAFRTGDFRIGDVGSTRYDVVLANLTGGMICSAGSHIARLVTPGGTLVVSGFDEDERAAVEAALSGLDVRAIYTEDGWVGLVLTRG